MVKLHTAEYSMPIDGNRTAWKRKFDYVSLVMPLHGNWRTCAMSRKSEVRTKFQKNVVALWNMWMWGARHCTVAVESLGKMFARNVSNEKCASMAFKIPTMIWCCWIWSWTKWQTGNWNSCERTRENWKDTIWSLVSKVALYRRKPATKLTRIFCYGGWCSGLCCHWRCCCCWRCCYTEHCFAPWHFRSSIDLVPIWLKHELNDEPIEFGIFYICSGNCQLFGKEIHPALRLPVAEWMIIFI